MMKVTVLGCGPAGLLAAQGAEDAGAKVTIVSTKVKSKIAGAQFIHEDIPELGIIPKDVHIIKRGTAEGYSRKVYGVMDHETSWANYEHGDIFPAWSMDEVYAALWDKWESKIQSEVVTQQVLDELESGNSDMLISSVPAHVLCSGPHIFESNEVYVISGECSSTRNSIVYNGDGRVHWHRASFLFGHTGIEYSTATRKAGHKAPPIGARKIVKPQHNDCGCRPQWRRVGRYGKWKRGVLAHSAYFEVNDALLTVR